MRPLISIPLFLLVLVGSASCPPLAPPAAATPGNDGNGGSGDTATVLAPIHSVEISVAESFPPQYTLTVVSGLPNGCAKFDRYEVDRSGNTIAVTILNREPAPLGVVACTAIYGMKEHRIPLGTRFVSGDTYRVVVNGVAETLAAQ